MGRSYRQTGLSPDGETIVLQKFHGLFASPDYVSESWLQEHKELLRTGVGLDLETTGLESTVEKIIEIAARPFQYRTDTGEIISVDDGYAGLQDPGKPLSEVIKKVTGMTDEMLQGRSIDWQTVSQLLESAEVIIAHNARFDRPFMDQVLPLSKTKLWACSWSQIDWTAKGFPVQKLEVLSLYHGFFVDAHRAVNDVNAMLKLLNCPDAESGRPYLKELLDECLRPRTIVSADGSPFSSKDVLRLRGYRWNTAKKVWARSVCDSELPAEIEWLEKTVYGGAFRGSTLSVACKDNFTIKD